MLPNLRSGKPNKKSVEKLQQSSLTGATLKIQSKQVTTYCRCRECHERYDDELQLNRHLVQAHGAAYKYNCKFCLRVFKAKHNLRQHRVQHDARRDKRRFQCLACRSRFTQFSSMAAHLHRRHGVTGKLHMTSPVAKKASASCTTRVASSQRESKTVTLKRKRSLSSDDASRVGGDVRAVKRTCVRLRSTSAKPHDACVVVQSNDVISAAAAAAAASGTNDGVSCIARAGWSAGIFSASKLW